MFTPTETSTMPTSKKRKQIALEEKVGIINQYDKKKGRPMSARLALEYNIPLLNESIKYMYRIQASSW